LIEIINSKAKENVFSRAYLNFKNIETLVEFFKEFDGHLYIDSKGKIINNIFFIQKKKKKKKKIDFLYRIKKYIKIKQ